MHSRRLTMLLGAVLLGLFASSPVDPVLAAARPSLAAPGGTPARGAGGDQQSVPPAAPANVRVVQLDVTPPTVALTAPANNATVSGAMVTVSATAADAVGVAGVQFLLDGASLGPELTSTPFSLSWNTQAASNGQHRLSARARDAAGNTTTSTVVTVTVSNIAADTTPPTVSLTAPANNATVSGTTATVSATATDAVGVVGVQFLLDGANLGAEDVNSPYSFVWNSTTASDGQHTVSARARDAAGNTTTSAVVTVTVKNGTAQQIIAITAPASGATVSGPAVTVMATVSVSTVIGVQFTVDGVNQGPEVTSEPFSLSWNTTKVANGTHSLAAVMRDASGSTVTSSAISVTTVGAPPGNLSLWNMTFNDEFDGTALDKTKWATTYMWGGRSNNDELEWYVDDAGIVSGGTLKLVAKKQTVQSGHPYTSGIISSHNGFSQMYGYFEIRMKIPSGQGLWPAFWLLPLPNNWPPEIDVMENLGHAPGTVYFTNHWSANYPKPGEPKGGQAGGSYNGPDMSKAFHTYGVEWNATTIIWYIDGVERSRTTSYVPIAGNGVTAMYLIANLAVGGSWPGSPDASTVFPCQLEIDYVRAFKR